MEDMETAQQELENVFKQSLAMCKTLDEGMVHLSTYLAAAFVEELSDCKEEIRELGFEDWKERTKQLLEECDATAFGLLSRCEDALEVVAECLLTMFSYDLEAQEVHAFQEGEHVLAIMKEDGIWHPALVVELVGEPKDKSYLLRFKAFGNPQVTVEEDIVVDLTYQEAKEEEEETGEPHCKVCGRDRRLTFHHLIPRETHSRVLKKGKLVGELESLFLALSDPESGGQSCSTARKHWLGGYGIMVCGPCHRQIHRIAPNEVLALNYNTLDKILATPAIQRWKKWASKQRRAPR